MSNDNYEIILQNLSNFIGSSNEIEIRKENCKNFLNKSQNNINEEEINNILNIIFDKDEVIQKQEALNKLSSFYLKEDDNNENEEEKKQENNLDDNEENNEEYNDNNILDIDSNIKGLVQPKNKIKVPNIIIKPHKISSNKKNENNNNNEIKKEKRRPFNKKPLAADKITYNKIDIKKSNNNIFDKINQLRNEFEIEQKVILPINKKPIIYENKTNNEDEYNYIPKKNYKEEFSSQNFNLNDINQRKEYIHSIKDKLRNFAEEKKQREKYFHEKQNPFDNISDMLNRIKDKKNEEY